MQHAITLRHIRAVMVPHGTGVLPPPHLATVLKNVESLGFTFSESLIARLHTQSISELFQFYTEVIPALRAIVGADVAYRPMYPNFPAQVIELGEEQDIRQICARLLAAKTALSAADRADVESLIAAYGDDLADLIPAA